MSTIRKWQQELRAIFEEEGGRNITFEVTRGTHLRATGLFDDKPVSILCSLSPSDHRAPHRVRRDLRHTLKGVK